MKTFEVNEKTVDVSWKNVLVNHSHAINHVSDMAQTASLFGYPFMLWNGRVYAIPVVDSTDYGIIDTSYIESDIS
jgi:hypothetical protein